MIITGEVSGLYTELVGVYVESIFVYTDWLVCTMNVLMKLCQRSNIENNENFAIRFFPELYSVCYVS